MVLIYLRLEPIILIVDKCSEDMTNLESNTGRNRPPRPEVLRETIRFLAEDSRNVAITDHAEDRMYERDITITMMMRVLRSGMIKGEVEQGKKSGDWVVKVAGQMLGNRDVGVVTAVMQDQKLVIITVEWEDM